MSFLEKAGKMAVRGTTAYFESQARSTSRNSTFTDEQKDSILNFADKMDEIHSSFSNESDDSDY